MLPHRDLTTGIALRCDRSPAPLPRRTGTSYDNAAESFNATIKKETHLPARMARRLRDDAPPVGVTAASRTGPLEARQRAEILAERDPDIQHLTDGTHGSSVPLDAQSAPCAKNSQTG